MVPTLAFGLIAAAYCPQHGGYRHVSSAVSSPGSASIPMVMSGEGKESLGFFGRLAKGLDDIVDDALDRKLGNGASFYGKRKSSFYGKNDPFKRKGDERDGRYVGRGGGSYYVWDREWNMALTRKQARDKKRGILQRPAALSDDDE